MTASSRRFLMAGAALCAILGMTAAQAQALRDNWCADIKIRFLVGGAEGHGFRL